MVVDVSVSVCVCEKCYLYRHKRISINDFSYIYRFYYPFINDSVTGD